MSESRLSVFSTDESVTLSFRDRIYVIERKDPFFNIAQLCLERRDFIPFYVEIAKREGLGPEFRDRLMEEVKRLQDELD